VPKKLKTKERNEEEMDKEIKWGSSQIISPFHLLREKRKETQCHEVGKYLAI
jgi:hypothetical protein